LNKHCLFHSMLLFATHHINVSISPCMDLMEDPSPQTILRYLHELGFDPNYLRFKDEFYDRSHTQDEAFIRLGHYLRWAYFRWYHQGDSDTTHTYLENVRAMCNEVLKPAYQSKYNTVLSYFETMTSRAGTPVHVQEQGARMQNLLLRMTSCLH
jgi:hypothetical protein